jgi:hypothetical protein
MDRLRYLIRCLIEATVRATTTRQDAHCTSVFERRKTLFRPKYPSYISTPF